MLTYRPLEPQEKTFVELESKYKTFHSWKSEMAAILSMRKKVNDADLLDMSCMSALFTN